MCRCVCEEIYRHFLIHLWRLRNPKIAVGSGRLRGSIVWFLFEFQGLRTRRAGGMSSSPKDGRHKTQEKPMFQFKAGEDFDSAQRLAGIGPSYHRKVSLFVLIRA
jgi:hypothetical protein